VFSTDIEPNNSGKRLDQCF